MLDQTEYCVPKQLSDKNNYEYYDIYDKNDFK